MTIRWWMPLTVGVLVVSTALATLIWASFKVRPQKVEDHPYAESAHEDLRRAERQAFRERGYRLMITVDGEGATLTLTEGSGAPLRSGVVETYRPNDLASDASIAWKEMLKPLRVPLPARGAWGLRVELRDSEGVVLLHEERINRP